MNKNNKKPILFEVTMTYKVKGGKEKLPYVYISFTTQHDKKKVLCDVRHHFKHLFDDLGCKLLKCKLTYWNVSHYEENEAPLTFEKALEVFK